MRTLTSLLILSLGVSLSACDGAPPVSQIPDEDVEQAVSALLVPAIGRRCATVHPSQREQTKIDKAETARFAIVDSLRTSDEPVRVPVYVHIITPIEDSGWVTKSDVAKQIAVLNNAFKGGQSEDATVTPFSFYLAGTDRTVNAAWSAMLPNSSAEKAAKQSLRQGGRDALNLYIASPEGGLLGWATFPHDYEKAPFADGVVILHKTLQGYADSPYSLGDTAVHEVGHWLGLYHTFQGGCGKRGDSVADTASERFPASGCPRTLDTCPNAPGFDPVQNFMDYSDDACMVTFTTRQSSRMHRAFLTYRGPLAAR